MNFLEKLDQLIKNENSNKSQLSKESQIPYTTIDGWYKKGYSGLKISTLMKLAAHFDVSLDYLMDDTITNPSYGKTDKLNLTAEEISLIQKYRDLDEYGKEMVQSILEVEQKRNQDLSLKIAQTSIPYRSKRAKETN